MVANPCFLSDVPREKVDKALTPERVAGIWRYARDTYIDKGTSYENTLSAVAGDLNLPRDVVTMAFSKPKALRNITNEVFRRQEARRIAIRNAKNYVTTMGVPRAAKIISAAVSVPRRVLTFGHGPVFPVTHALDLAGSEFRTYFKANLNAWKFASKAEHGAAMDWLRNNDPDLYTTARRSGLEIDPDRGPQGILSGGSGGWARRAWDSLKIARLELFKQRWEAVPAAERNLTMGKLLAQQINHSTGVMSAGEWGFGALSRGMFAPQLTASKIAKTFVDPAKTVATWAKVANGQEVPFAERHIASLRVRKAAKFFGSYVGLLAANQGLLSALNQDDKINFTDPSKSDWLRPKFAGHTLNLRGTSELIRLLGSLAAISQSSRQERHGDTKTEAARDAIAKYAQYKIDPALQLAGEAAFQEDTFGRPLPFSSEEGTRSHPKYSVPEYVLSKGPIFLGGATREIYESFREEGLSASNSTALIRGLIVGASEFAGYGIRKEHSKPAATAEASTPAPAF